MAAQTAANEPPWKIGGATYLEASFTNTLVDSTFTAANTYTPTGFFDKFPNGWTIVQTDTDGLMRVRLSPYDTLLPNLQLLYSLRANYTQIVNLPVVTVGTPSVPANNTFQVIVQSGLKNTTGYVRLVSNTGLYQTAKVSLIQGEQQLLTLNVMNDAGPVKIQWFQVDPDTKSQSLSLFGAMSSFYLGAHSFIPYNESSTADTVTLPAITAPVPWVFSKGTLRVASELEDEDQPVSWSIYGSGGEKFLEVAAGIMSSDFSSTVVDLTSYTLPGVLAGEYRLRYTVNQNFVFITKEPEAAPVETEIPFAFDLSFTPSFLSSPLTVQFSSYSPLYGSGRILYFSFSPR